MAKTVGVLNENQFGVLLDKIVNPQAQLKIKSLGDSSYEFQITYKVKADKEFSKGGENVFKEGEPPLAVFTSNEEPKTMSDIDLKFKWQDQSLTLNMIAKDPPADKGDHMN